MNTQRQLPLRVHFLCVRRRARPCLRRRAGHGEAHYYKASVYPAVRTLLESVDTGIYFLTVDEEIYMVRNLLDHDFTPYAMLVLELEKSEAMRLN